MKKRLISLLILLLIPIFLIGCDPRENGEGRETADAAVSGDVSSESDEEDAVTSSDLESTEDGIKLPPIQI